MKESPLVSVICLCHNHEKYVSEAIDSVLLQTHPSIELIIVDDGSNDHSVSVITNKIQNTDIKFISLDKSVGNCKAFNLGFNASKGDYLIDLAADDLLMPDRIAYGLRAFEKENIGVEFCNVMNVKPDRQPIEPHFKSNGSVQEGDLYELLILKYYISAPGMLIKREVLERLEGYDETLSYEDFDFWIRSSRLFHYGYTDKILVQKRILPKSLSAQQFSFRSQHQKSTLMVCQKIKSLNRTKKEDQALRKRCMYEIKQCLRFGNFELIPKFFKLIS